jgi:hypothetical protein
MIDGVRRLCLSERHDIWCLVDADDWPWISETTWNYGWHAKTPWKFYAKRNVGPARSTLYLHREILLRFERVVGAGALVVDHINGQSLDNRKANLRWVTPRVNSANKKRRDDIPPLDALLAQLGADACEAVPF